MTICIRVFYFAIFSCFRRYLFIFAMFVYIIVTICVIFKTKKTMKKNVNNIGIFGLMKNED